MVTSRDVQEIVSKLSSDKAKPREEGIKLLNTWLEGERSTRFCKNLGENTSKLKPDDIPHSLVLLYIERVETSLGGKSSSRCNQKEEPFCCISTFHALLEHPPGDFPDDVKEGIVKVFVQIFSFTRDEGKISQKLIECVNTYLLKDGPNLGYLSLEIHNVVRQFLFCWWLTTRGRGLKLNLIRGAADGSSLVEQLLDVLCKELDQSSLTGVGVPWTEA